MNKFLRKARIVTVGLGAVAILAGGLASGTAHAETTPNYNYTVRTTDGIVIRSGPSLHTSTKGSITQGEKVKVDCRVAGSSVGNDRDWYFLSSREGWISGRFASPVGAEPKTCPSNDTEFGVGQTTVGVNTRSGPTTKDQKLGSIGKGKRVDVICSAKGASVQGNTTWYLLKNNSWVSAEYVRKTAAVPSNWVACDD